MMSTSQRMQLIKEDDMVRLAWKRFLEKCEMRLDTTPLPVIWSTFRDYCAMYAPHLQLEAAPVQERVIDVEHEAVEVSDPADPDSAKSVMTQAIEAAQNERRVSAPEKAAQLLQEEGIHDLDEAKKDETAEQDEESTQIEREVDNSIDDRNHSVRITAINGRSISATRVVMNATPRPLIECKEAVNNRMIDGLTFTQQEEIAKEFDNLGIEYEKDYEENEGRRDESLPVPQPEPQPQFEPNPIIDPIYQLIAQALERIGFSPQQVDAKIDERIAEQTAACVADYLTSYQPPSTFEVKLQDMPLKEIDGTPPYWFERAFKMLAVNQEVLLVGPAGSGKSYGARLLAKALDMPFYATSLSGGVDEGVLQGWLMPVQSGGAFTYVPALFVTAYEQGGLMLLDELDAADANMLLIINDAVSNNEFFIPSRYENPRVIRHPNFRCIAAANTFGHGANRQYVGRAQLDEATLSRFRMGQIELDFDKSLEKRLYDERVVKYGHRLRERCRAQKGWKKDVSTRDIAKAHVKLAAWGSAEDVFYEYFSDWRDEDLERVKATRDHEMQRVILD